MNCGKHCALVLATLGLAVPASAADHSLNRTTTKSASALRDCFTAAQVKASNAVSFVPNERSGGVFSNAEVLGVRNAYSLRVIDNGRYRTVSMVPANPLAAAEPPVAAAIERCL